MTATAPGAPSALVGSRARRAREAWIGRLFFAAALVSVAITAFIIFTVFEQAVEFLLKIDLSQLVAPGWFPRRGLFDVATIFVGTLLVTGIAMLIAGPIGILSAIYLSEYASPRTRGTVEADPRDPGRHPQRRPRLLRPHLHQPDDRPDARALARRASTWPRRRSPSAS